MQVTMRGTGQLLTASAQHSSEANTAKQQAALDMVHQLQQAILAMLTASQPDKALVTPMQTSTDHTSTLDMTVLHEGDAENSMPEIGNVVKVQYQLVLDPARKQETSVDAKPELEVQESNSTNPEDHGTSMPPVCVSSRGYQIWLAMSCLHTLKGKEGCDLNNLQAMKYTTQAASDCAFFTARLAAQHNL